jgi:hypothetical protein
VSDATAEREAELAEQELADIYGEAHHGRVDDLDLLSDRDDARSDDSEGSLIDFIVSDDDPIATYASSGDDEFEPSTTHCPPPTL